MGDVTEVVREHRRYDDGTLVAMKVLELPPSDKFPNGLNYAFHYGYDAGEDAPIIRLDNDDGFGSHDIHLGDEEYHFDFPGLVPVYEAFVAALPPEKRSDVSDSI